MELGELGAQHKLLATYRLCRIGEPFRVHERRVERRQVGRMQRLAGLACTCLGVPREPQVRRLGDSRAERTQGAAEHLGLDSRLVLVREQLRLGAWALTNTGKKLELAGELVQLGMHLLMLARELVHRAYRRLRAQPQLRRVGLEDRKSHRQQSLGRQTHDLSEALGALAPPLLAVRLLHVRAARGERLDVLRKLLRSHRLLALPRRLLLGEHVAQVGRQSEPELEPRVHLTLQMRDALLLAGELLARGLHLFPLLPNFRHLALDGR